MSTEAEREAFEVWAGTEYRNAETYGSRDFNIGLSAWQARAALAEAAQAPKDFYLRAKVADLLHLLQHATISVPSRGDDEQAYRTMDAIRNHLAVVADAAAPQPEGQQCQARATGATE